MVRGMRGTTGARMRSGYHLQEESGYHPIGRERVRREWVKVERGTRERSLEKQDWG